MKKSDNERSTKAAAKQPQQQAAPQQTAPKPPKQPVGPAKEEIDNPDEAAEAVAKTIGALGAKIDEYEDMVKRQQAEFDNYRKRTIEEKQQLLKYAPESFIKQLLPILNNYEKALDQQGKELHPAAKSFLEGFVNIKQQLDSIINAHAVKPSTQAGDAFNPLLHQAMLQEPGQGDIETVGEVFEQGYLFHDRVIKTAQVKVLQKKQESPAPLTEPTAAAAAQPSHYADTKANNTTTENNTSQT